MSNFNVYYDDQPNDIVNRIAAELEKFGLTIVDVDCDLDGIMKYEIVKLK